MIARLVDRFHYRFAKKRADREDIEDRYNPRHVARLLAKRVSKGKALFHFNNINDHVTLFYNGQLNARGEEEMFRAWGSSEFKGLKPQAVFEELEKEIVKIRVISASGRDSNSFSSYGEFIRWLANEGDKN